MRVVLRIARAADLEVIGLVSSARVEIVDGGAGGGGHLRYSVDSALLTTGSRKTFQCLREGISWSKSDKAEMSDWRFVALF